MNERERGNPVATAQIDRLVSGDLGDPERRSLLAWLDEEPTRWRACALAFLEAQAWEEAACEETGGRRHAAGERVQDSGFGVQTVSAIKDGTLHANHQTRHPLRSSHWLVLAGVVLAAFAIGIASGRAWLPAHPAGPQFAQPQPSSPPPPDEHALWATVSIPTNLDPRLAAEIKLPVTPAPATSVAEWSIPEHVRKQWERRGFELVKEVRYLPAKMPDGRIVMVPVNKIQVKLKGTPVS